MSSSTEALLPKSPQPSFFKRHEKKILYSGIAAIIVTLAIASILLLGASVACSSLCMKFSNHYIRILLVTGAITTGLGGCAASGSFASLALLCLCGRDDDRTSPAER